jgi:hypothetical protein
MTDVRWLPCGSCRSVRKASGCEYLICRICAARQSREVTKVFPAALKTYPRLATLDGKRVD